jgi:hypothetical protein
MSNAETLYTVRDYGPDVLERARLQVVKCPLYRNGVLVAPTASGSTYTLYDEDGTTVLATGAVTVTADVAQYSIAAASIPATLGFGEKYRAAWLLVLPDGTTRTFRREVSIALQAINPVITDADLLAEYPDLARDLPSTASSWQGFIDEAWKRILARLRQKGAIPHLIVSDTELRDAHRELTLMLIAKWWRFKGTNAETWKEMQEYHAAAYEAAWTSANVRLDTDQDGAADGDGRTGLASTVTHINPAPRQSVAYSSDW